MTISADKLNYNDFSSLARLRVDARNDQKSALKEVAKQFESVFVQMMIKSMRDASEPLQSDLFHSDQSKAYTDMYDKQLGLELTQSNGIGLADVIVRQLSPQQGQNLAKPTAPTLAFNQIPKTANTAEQVVSSEHKRVLNIKAEAVQTSSLSDDYELSIDSIDKATNWSNAEDFIRDSWPHAKRAGQALGIDPKVIVAQSALETGWGKKVHVNQQGENSYSLFGIKAGADWTGKKVQFNTLEFRSGVMNRERASFRAYDSLSESYQDYVNFLQKNPRYQKVVDASSAKDYAVQLQKAGYATDPQYSEKIERIRQGELLNKVVSELKLSSKEPLV